MHAQDVSIFSATTAGEAITTSEFIHDFDTTVRNDGSHTLVGATNIQMAAGHHLVIYNSRFDRTGSSGNRTETQTNLNLAGADLPIGWSQGYTRWDNNQKEAITAGGAIINVAADNDVLQLQSFRTDNNGAATQQRLSGATGIQLLKLDDDLDYLLLNAAGADPDQALPVSTTNWLRVAYDNEVEKDPGSFAFTASGTDITLVQQGHYLIFANTYVFESAEREGIVQRLTLDGAEVSGSRTSVYIRGNQNSCSEGATSLGMIIETSAPNQILNVEILQDIGRVGHIVGDRTALSIVKLPDHADYVRLEDTSGDQDLNATATLLYDDATSQLEVSSGFTHSTSGDPGRVGVVANGDYLFFAQQYDDNDGVQRGFYNQGWQVNGSGGFAAHGQTGRYSRNSGGADKFGNWSGFIAGLSAADYVETLTQPLANTGANTADTMAIQGIRIDNILGPDLFPPGIVGKYPEDDSSGAYIGTNLVLTFDEDIALSGTGTITIVEDPYGSPVNNVINLPDAGVTVDGAQLIIDPDASLPSGTMFAVLISSDAINDLSLENGGGPNAFPGISDNTVWNFSTDLLDASPPGITSTVPVDNAIGVTVDSALSVTFDDPIFIGSGNITIYNIATGAVHHTIDVTDASQISISDRTLTITPAINLPSASEVAVQWAAGIVRNRSDIGTAQLADTTTWNFTTTQASLSNPVAVLNQSFEDDVIGDGLYGNTAPSSWSTIINGGSMIAGVWNPDAATFSDEAPKGSNISYVFPNAVDTEAGLVQVMADAYLAANPGAAEYPAEYNFIHGPDYQLKVRVGYAAPPYKFPGYKVQLLAGGTLLAEDAYEQFVPQDSFIEVTLEYAFNEANAALNGEPLEIRLLALADPVGNGSIAFFDDVRLTYGFINPAADTGGPYVVSPSYNLELDATGSRPSDGQAITLYEWDLNNDGVFGDVANVAQPTALTDAQLISNHGMALGDNTIALRVTDSAGKVALATTNVRIELSAVTPGADFVLIANEDLTDNGRWEDEVAGNPSGLELLLDDSPAVTRQVVSSATQIRYAYSFPGGWLGNKAGALLVNTGTTTPRSFQDAPGDWSAKAMSMEVWFRPDELVPDDPMSTNGQVIFEDGGGSGLGLFIDDAGNLVCGQDANTPLIAYDLINDFDFVLTDIPIAEFIQVVITRTQAGVTTMYINGQALNNCTVNGTPFVAGTATDDDTDWSGGDPAAFGTLGGVNVGGRGSGQVETESFDGSIAIVRLYSDQVLTPAQVAENYNAVSSPDVTAPFVENTSPADDSTGVLVRTNLVASFDSDVQLTGSGTVTLKNLDDGSGLSDIVINMSDAGQVSLSGRDLIIDPTVDLAFGTNYAVRISNDAITDMADTPNAFAGINDDTTWNFTTVDQDFSAPVLVGMNPPDNAAAVSAAGVSLIATFDDDLLLGMGDITITDLDDGTTTQIIAVDDTTKVALSGNTLTITPGAPLAAGKHYSVRMDAGVVSNTSYLDYAGIANDTTWDFTINSPLFADGFETPDVTAAQSTGNTSGAVDTSKWVRATAGFGATRCGIVDETAGAFTDPTGEQAFAFRYTNSGLTTKEGAVGSFVQGTTYTISFDVTADSGATPYTMKLLSVQGGSGFFYYDVRNDNNATVLDTKTGNAPVGSYQTISFDYTATASDNGKDIVLRFIGASTSANIDNVSVTLASVDDATPPDLVDITNPGGEANMEVGQTEIFTLTFSEDIDAITVMANDFTNYGTASYTIGTIAETADNSGIFTVPVTMTSTGTFQLQIVEGAVIKDMSGNQLDTSTAINDDVTINVVAPADPYGGWAAGFAGLTDSAPGTDFDQGGLATGLEWVLGGDPTDASDDRNIRPSFDGAGASSVTFTFRRADAAFADSNTAIAVEYGSNMSFGSTATHGIDGVSFAVNDDGAGAGVDIVTVTIPKSLATGGKMFVRLKVTVTTP